MTPEQIALVQATFVQIAPKADTLADLFYERLFTSDPALRPLFMGDMGEQRHKLMTVLTVVVPGLDHLDQLLPAIEALGRRHATYGVRNVHYATFCDALLWTLGQVLGDEFTPAARTAWTIAYATLAGVMWAQAAALGAA